ncbi:DUF805 domain-containing protein [Pseudorhodoplanes sinuspersici]|uniref:Uncharacterized protein n=1 Tax=Pseudorhodoplanes sinuspersici TaxID=1235591 RepID=A0A1W6ZVS8_9HYPH|nr:hypothetical protein [Pseudorhodoplanes sinuspersici]ARQ01420.1 hypothetical protein CAK95_21665 [Pseudorhodoplanes sinuspersici]RKE73107.1 hypothetical protein DFP91_0986 [Pseudorhodoplanes sinuspersici]
MSILESFSPSGELEQGPYVRSMLALLIGAVLSHLLTAPAVLTQLGILPFLIVQIVIVWWWFALIVKRLHNAERSILGVTAVALISFTAVIFLAVMLVLQVSDTSANAVGSWLPASIGLLLYPFVFFFNLVTGPATSAQDLHIALLALMIVAPPLLTIWWSVWAALQPSELHTTE